MSVGDVLAAVERDRVFYDESSGGVTFSGGEPFAQSGFLLALLRAAKRAGLRTAVDTCGFAARGVLLAAAPLVDLFLYDLKILDAAQHQRVVGLPLAPILDNLEALGRADARVWLRIPIIPGYTDDEAGLAEAARIARDNPAVRRVHLLPYHRGANAKSARMRRAYALTSVIEPSVDRMSRLADIFRSRGLDTRLGG